jgi:hypothetical protein
MTLFINHTADKMSEQLQRLVDNFEIKELKKIDSTKLNALVDEFDQNMKSYESTKNKADKREYLPNQLMIAAGIIATAAVPTGMMVGAAFLENIVAGGAIGAIVPVGMGLGAGLISYLNNRTKNNLTNDEDFDKKIQSKHNEKHGNDFLQKLEALDIGDALKDIKEIVERNIKNPQYHQENVAKEIKTSLKKNNLQ